MIVINKERMEKIILKGWIEDLNEYQIMLLYDYLEYNKRVGDIK